MRYHITGSSQVGVMGLKRDTLEGALKKANELRQQGIYNDVQIIDIETGHIVKEQLADGDQAGN
ncbi:hypothetical protein GBZ48_03015 [Azospirillum melinis]|uniref:Uncharacterized protein n=1 Tax=Azospirillum melinis TaxID=328839 RepID=A0ABX2K4R3_9PROT|nr:hypothetical protein [Azospirillum melinis]MBP2306394.1 hypothetical protein [Azospirillum melinis]NUA98248.1 hypothetical protein [Azospirillum melinis]